MYDPGGVALPEAEMVKLLSAIRVFIPKSSVSEVVLREEVGRILVDCSEVYNEARAERWAAGFEFPPEVSSTHARMLAELGGPGCLHRLVEQLQNSRLSDRFNVTRAKEFVDDEEYARLVDLANGMQIVTSAEFQAAIEPYTLESLPPLRRKYTDRVKHAVNKLVYELYMKELIIILPLSVAMLIPRLSLSFFSWTNKKGKDFGRLLIDPSYGPNPLNGGAKELCIDRWGKATHPTITQICTMVCGMAEKHGWDKIVLWKTDLSGAFTLLNICSQYAHLTAAQLSGDLVAIHIAGYFGWTGTPMAFGVISRVIERAVARAIDGVAVVYTDDCIGCATECSVRKDVDLANDICRRLLGPDAVALDKELIARTAECIGWQINLDDATVAIGARNLHKALHCFLSVDLSKPVPFTTIERMASFAERYGLVCFVLRPYTGHLYSYYKGLTNRNSSHTLNSHTVTCIVLWRAFLLSLKLEAKATARSIISLGTVLSPEFSVWFDGSLTGAGFCVLRGRQLTATAEVLAWVSLTYPFKLEKAGGLLDSSYQNSSELIAVTLGLAWLQRHYPRQVHVALVGDSNTALSWAVFHHFAVGRSERAAMTFANVLMQQSSTIVDVTYIDSESNFVCDELSRGVEHEELKLSFPQCRVCGLELEWLERLVRVMDPNRGLDSFDDVLAYQLSIQTLV